MTTLKVQIAPELLAKLEARAYETIGGRWDIPLTPPEVAVFVAAYRERDALAVALQRILDFPIDEGASPGFHFATVRAIARDALRTTGDHDAD